VGGRPDRKIVDQGADGDVHEGAGAHHRIEQRAATAAMRILGRLPL
jgi:hypothetical protein